MYIPHNALLAGVSELSRLRAQATFLLHTTRKRKAIVTSEFLGHLVQLLPVVREIDSPTVAGFDAGPDNVPVLTAVVVDMKDDRAGLAEKS
jgi:hypothetical protein